MGGTDPRPDLVLFDFFDTLTRWSRPPRDVICQVLDSHGVSVEPHRIFEEAMALSRTFPRHDEHPQDGEWQYWRHYDAALLRRLGADPRPEVLEDIQSAFERQVWLEALPNAHEVVRAVTGAGIRAALLTNATYGMLRDADRLGFSPLFESVFLSQRMGLSKPDPRIFTQALRAMGVGPSRTWMVGDNPKHDIDGARAAGIHAVWVPARPHPPVEGVTQVQDLGGLLPLLAR
jgi:putative hydrolase of the HAD superfamily